MRERHDDAQLVWPENEPALRAFLLCATQWRTLWVGGLEGGRVLYTGLDYAACLAVLNLQNMAQHPGILHDIRVMEQAALTLINQP